MGKSLVRIAKDLTKIVLGVGSPVKSYQKLGADRSTSRTNLDGYYHCKDVQLVEDYKMALLSHLTPVIIPSGKILDVACGSGRYLQILTEEFSLQGYGIDTSPHAINRFAKTVCPTATFEIADATKGRPFPEVLFDNVICIGLIQHIAFFRVTKLIRNLSATLVPGGMLFLTYPPARTMLEGFRNHQFQGYTDQFIAKRIERAGLELLKQEVVDPERADFGKYLVAKKP